MTDPSGAQEGLDQVEQAAEQAAQKTASAAAKAADISLLDLLGMFEKAYREQS